MNRTGCHCRLYTSRLIFYSGRQIYTIHIKIDTLFWQIFLHFTYQEWYSILADISTLYISRLIFYSGRYFYTIHIKIDIIFWRIFLFFSPVGLCCVFLLCLIWWGLLLLLLSLWLSWPHRASRQPPGGDPRRAGPHHHPALEHGVRRQQPHHRIWHRVQEQIRYGLSRNTVTLAPSSQPPYPNSHARVGSQVLHSNPRPQSLTPDAPQDLFFSSSRLTAWTVK